LVFWTQFTRGAFRSFPDPFFGAPGPFFFSALGGEFSNNTRYTSPPLFFRKALPHFCRLWFLPTQVSSLFFSPHGSPHHPPLPFFNSLGSSASIPFPDHPVIFHSRTLHGLFSPQPPLRLKAVSLPTSRLLFFLAVTFFPFFSPQVFQVSLF